MADISQGDFDRHKRNINRLIAGKATDEDIGLYLRSQNITASDLERAAPQPFDPDIPSQARGQAGAATSGLADPDAPGETSFRQGTSPARKAVIFNSAVYDSISSVVGFPADVVAQAFNVAGVELSQDDPVGGSESIRNFLESIGGSRLEAKEASERIFARAGAEVGAALPFIATGGASALLTKVPQIAGGGGKLLAAREALVGPFRTAPITTALAETGAAGLAGAGAQLASEVTEGAPPGVQQTAETVAGLAGGFTPAALGGVARSGKALFTGLTPAMLGPRARGIVEKRLAENVADAPRARDRLAGEGAIAEGVPGFRDTPASLIDEVGISTLERSIVSQDPLLAEQFRVTRVNNVQAQSDAAQALRPTDGSAPATQTVVRDRFNKLTQTADDHLTAAQNAADSLKNRQLPEEASAQVRGVLETGRKKFRDDARVFYSELDPDGTVGLSPDPLFKAQKKILSGVSRTEERDSVIDELMTVVSDLRPKKPAQTRRIGFVGEPVEVAQPAKAVRISFREARVLRGRLAQRVREEEALPAPNFNRIRKLNILQDAVDDTLDSLGTDLSRPELAARYREISKWFGDNAKIYRQGPVGEQIRKGRSSKFATGTLDAFFGKTGTKSGTREGAEQLRAAVGGEADDAIYDWAVGRIYDQTANTGKRVDAGKVRRWIAQRESAFNQFPAVRDRLRNISKVQERVDQLVGRKKRILELKNRGSTQLALEGNAPEAVRLAMGKVSPVQREREIRGLVKLMRGDKGAISGLRSMVFDDMWNSVRTDAGEFVSGQRIRNWVIENRRVLKAVGYKENEIRTMFKVAEASDAMQLQVSPANSLRPEKARAQLGMQFVLSRMYAVGRTFIGPGFVAADTTARLFKNAVDNATQDQVEAIWREAWTNPQLMSDLMTPMGQGGGRQAFNRVRAFLLSSGIIGAQKFEERRRDVKDDQRIRATSTI